jgi:PEP-CTERM motif
MKRLSSRLETLGLGFVLIFFCSSSTAEATPITIGWFSPVTLFPLLIDTVEELEVQTGVYSTEFGREAAEVSVSTKGGTKYHSALFEFVRDDAFDSRPYGSTSVGRDKASFKRNQLGFTLPRVANGTNTSFSVTDIDQILDAGVHGSVGFDLNEAQNYGLLLSGLGYGVFLGYADKAFFADKGAGDGFHCVSGNCHDADVIPIRATADQVPVPEPATMTLLVAGLAGLAAGRYGRARKARRTGTRPPCAECSPTTPHSHSRHSL